MTEANDRRPLVLVFICNDERFDEQGGRIDELTAHYEQLGYRVRFVRVDGTANWLSDCFSNLGLMLYGRASLSEAALVHVEAHMGCHGLRDLYREEEGHELPDDAEENRHIHDLQELVAPLRARLRALVNPEAGIVTYMYDMAEAVLEGLFGFSGPI